MSTEFWIEKPLGSSIDNASLSDAYNAIAEIIDFKYEYASFWIGHVDEEFVLEIHKNLELYFIFGDNQDQKIKIAAENWNVIKLYIKIFFDKDFSAIKNEAERL